MTVPSRRPAAWQTVLAFALVYLSWGTTFFAIRQGVHTYRLPPALFGGVRVGLAGVLLLGYLAARGLPVRLPAGEWLIAAGCGLLLFVGGNGMMTAAMDELPSGVAAVLVATTPLSMALLEMLWPRGDRLTARGWLGLAAGLGGVLLLLAPRWQASAGPLGEVGPLLCVGSTVTWSLGSLAIRHRRRHTAHLAAAAYQMAIGGAALALVGLALGEGARLTPGQWTAGAVGSFLYLLVAGSLVGFVAYHWLLGHVPAALVGTYAYVNPLIAVVVGWVLGGEEVSAPMVGGLVVILASVALVRGGSTPRDEADAPDAERAGAAVIRRSGPAAPRSPAPPSAR